MEIDKKCENTREDTYYIGTVEHVGCVRKLKMTVFPSGIWRPWLAVMRLVGPIITTLMMQMTLTPVASVFCGHLGDAHAFDGAAIAISVITVSVFSVAQGLGTACDTFFSRSFASKDKKIVGEYLQKALCIFALASLPCLAVHMNISYLLNYVGYDYSITKHADEYILYFIPGTLTFFMYMVLSKYIQNQNILKVNMMIAVVANVINAGCHYYFMYRLTWGIAGSAISLSISVVFMFLSTLAYILISKCYVSTWNGWSRRALFDWKVFANSAIFGMFMMCSEAWAFEVGIFAAGLLGTSELGSQAVLLNMTSLWISVPIGFQIGATIRIGHCLGANQADQAITTHRLTVTTLAIIALIPITVLNVFKNQLPYLVTNIDEIAVMVTALMHIVTLYMVFDGISLGFKASLYATARQKIGSVIVFVGYYVICLPIGLTLMFKVGLGTSGFWWGIVLCMIFQDIVMFIVVGRLDWQKECDKAMKNNKVANDQMREYNDNKQVSPKHVILLRVITAALLLMVPLVSIILRVQLFTY